MKEEELSPILNSLLERKNMKLSERSVAYLLRRLPREPLSFDAIFARINELSLEESRPAGLGVIRELIDNSNNTEK